MPDRAINGILQLARETPASHNGSQLKTALDKVLTNVYWRILPFAGGCLKSSNRSLLLIASVVYLSLPVDGVRTTLVTQAELPLASKEDASAGLILLFPR